MRILLPLMMLALLAGRELAAVDWNAVVLEAVRGMPRGGGYATAAPAGANLRAAVAVNDRGLLVDAATARPSFCSGATYLVLLRVLERARERQPAGWNAGVLSALAPAGQRDGQGVWGRWNANGPGAAVLFAELGAGRNFTDWTEARPGDFLKIFWREAVGRDEAGHLVVYLGTERRADGEWVRFWSSNKPDGYGEKSVPKRRIAYALFSRLERPEAFLGVDDLNTENAYLAGLTRQASSVEEMRRRARVSGP